MLGGQEGAKGVELGAILLLATLLACAADPSPKSGFDYRPSAQRITCKPSGLEVRVFELSSRILSEIEGAFGNKGFPRISEAYDFSNPALIGVKQTPDGPQAKLVFSPHVGAGDLDPGLATVLIDPCSQHVLEVYFILP